MRMAWTYPLCRLVRSGTVPKKPVPWRGKLWIITPDGERHEQSWSSKTPITINDTIAVMHQMVDDAIIDTGRQAVQAGWEVMSR